MTRAKQDFIDAVLGALDELLAAEYHRGYDECLDDNQVAEDAIMEAWNDGYQACMAEHVVEEEDE